MDATRFCRFREKRFFSIKRRHNDVRGGHDPHENVRGRLTHPRISSGTL